MRRRWLGMGVALLAAVSAGGQELMSDVLSGKLINPEVGVYAWYNLTDTESGSKFFLRQAIVGKDKVDGKTAYWVETEIIPQVGFPAMYKMLLTGPANDPKNVHRLLVREGAGPAEEVSLDTPEQGKESGDSDETKASERTSLGKEEVDTPQGRLTAEHLTIKKGSVQTELWLNDEVRPMGIVRMQSPQGELLLQRFGKGGEDGESRIDKESPIPASPGDWHVETRESEPTTNFNSGEKKP